MTFTIIDACLAGGIAILSVVTLLQGRRIADLKESVLIVARNPARARKALREKYGNKEGS